MTVKTAAGVAVAAACLMSFVAIPGAKSQPAPGYYGSQTYPGNAPTGSYGSTTGNYAPQDQDNASPNPALGTSGSAMGNNVPPNYQGTSSPNWSEGSNGSMTGSYDSQPSAADLGNTETVTNGPQGSPPPNWSARRNVVESERYDRLLETNRGFRQARIRKECGPITDQQLHQQCLDSFAQYEPAGATGYGTSTSSRHYRSNYGR
jgi:hypothetical protein